MVRLQSWSREGWRAGLRRGGYINYLSDGVVCHVERAFARVTKSFEWSLATKPARYQDLLTTPRVSYPDQILTEGTPQTTDRAKKACIEEGLLKASSWTYPVIRYVNTWVSVLHRCTTRRRRRGARGGLAGVTIEYPIWDMELSFLRSCRSPPSPSLIPLFIPFPYSTSTSTSYPCQCHCLPSFHSFSCHWKHYSIFRSHLVILCGFKHCHNVKVTDYYWLRWIIKVITIWIASVYCAACVPVPDPFLWGFPSGQETGSLFGLDCLTSERKGARAPLLAPWTLLGQDQHQLTRFHYPPLLLQSSPPWLRYNLDLGAGGMFFLHGFLSIQNYCTNIDFVSCYCSLFVWLSKLKLYYKDHRDDGLLISSLNKQANSDAGWCHKFAGGSINHGPTYLSCLIANSCSASGTICLWYTIRYPYWSIKQLTAQGCAWTSF